MGSGFTVQGSKPSSRAGRRRERDRGRARADDDATRGDRAERRFSQRTIHLAVCGVSTPSTYAGRLLWTGGPSLNFSTLPASPRAKTARDARGFDQTVAAAARVRRSAMCSDAVGLQYLISRLRLEQSRLLALRSIDEILFARASRRRHTATRGRLARPGGACPRARRSAASSPRASSSIARASRSALPSRRRRRGVAARPLREEGVPASPPIAAPRPPPPPPAISNPGSQRARATASARWGRSCPRPRRTAATSPCSTASSSSTDARRTRRRTPILPPPSRRASRTTSSATLATTSSSRSSSRSTARTRP